MKNEDAVKHLLIAMENLLAAEGFCKSCASHHPRVVADKCKDCVAGIPMYFNYEQKK